jgi:hypothetical protein
MTNFTKLAFVLFFAIFAVDVQADSIRIISGTVNNSSLNLQSGTSFSFSGGTQSSVFSFGLSYASGSSATPIIDVFQLNAVPGGSLGTINYSGTNAVVNGTNYSLLGFGGSLGQSSLIFNPLQSFTLPQAPTGSVSTFSTQVPFSMQGFLAGRTGCTQTGPCSPIPRVDLVGNGTATYNFTFLNGNWHLGSYLYSFENTSPTPEPATLILMGTGLAGIVGYARKRRRKQAN